jgi:hypothetical protein
MKKFILVILITLFSKSLVGQQTVGIFGENNWTNLWTNLNPKTTEYNDATEILNGDITENKTLFKKNVYILNGIVCVKNNATLTIEAGTVIKGELETDAALIISRNAKIIANGSLTDPIVFTSNKPSGQRKAGDWGGIAILGDAPINVLGGESNLEFVNPNISGTYGGANINSDSGILNFVRIEFAGKKIGLNKNFNGITIAGVGKKTVLNNIQVSFSDDDSVECLGGNVFLNNIVSYKATDDDFDFTQGTQVSLSNSLVLRNPFISSPTISRCLEVENYAVRQNTDFSKPNTNIFASNITLINTEANETGLVKEAIYIAENCNLRLQSSLVYGFAQGIILDDKILQKDVAKKIILDNTKFDSCKVVAKYDTITVEDELDFNFLPIEKTTQVNLFKEPNLKKTIDFRMKNSTNLVFTK